MSYTTPPQPVTLGQNVELSTPSNAPYSWVVISNLSAFLLGVNGSPLGSQWLEPFTAMIYPTGSGHQQLTLTPQTLAGTSPPQGGQGAQVQATWYLEKEEPQGQWPVSLTALAVASGLAAAGLAGASLLTVNANVAAGGGIANPATPSPFRLWSWGWEPQLLAPAWPTSEGVVFQAVGLAGFDAIDTLTFAEGSSDKLAGLWVPAPGTASWQNFTNAALSVYMNYSTT